MSSPYDALRALLSDRPIAFHPLLARLFGGIAEALLFQQLAYWSDKGADPDWIYKTQEDLEEETTLTRTKQENARAKLRKLGVIEEKKAGLPAKLHFRVCWDRVFQLLNSQGCSKPATKDAVNPQSSRCDLAFQSCGKGATQHAGMLQTLTKSTNKDDTKEDHSNHSNDINGFMSGEDAERITWIVRDIAREFADQAPVKSSATRACNLFKQSGLPLDAFLDVLQQARLRTKQYTGNITTERLKGGTRPKMSYWFGVVENLVGVKALGQRARSS